MDAGKTLDETAARDCLFLWADKVAWDPRDESPWKVQFRGEEKSFDSAEGACTWVQQVLAIAKAAGESAIPKRVFHLSDASCHQIAAQLGASIKAFWVGGSAYVVIALDDTGGTPILLPDAFDMRAAVQYGLLAIAKELGCHYHDGEDHWVHVPLPEEAN